MDEDRYSNDEAGAAYFERMRSEAAGEDEDHYWAETPDRADLAEDAAELRAAIRKMVADPAYVPPAPRAGDPF